MAKINYAKILFANIFFFQVIKRKKSQTNISKQRFIKHSV